MNPIDELFQQQLSEHTYAPPIKGFEAVQRNLKKNKKALLWKKVSLITGAAAALVSGFALFIQVENQELNPVVYEPRVFVPNMTEQESETTENFAVAPIISEHKTSTLPKNPEKKSTEKTKTESIVAEYPEVESPQGIANQSHDEKSSTRVKMKFTIIIEENEKAIAQVSPAQPQEKSDQELIKTFEEVYQYAGTQWGNFKNGEQVEAPKPIAELADQARNLNLASVRNGVNQFLNRN
jgi:hypothetical protein